MCGTQSCHPLPRCYSQVLPLHGGLPPSQQARVFNRPPKGGAGWVCSSLARLLLCMRKQTGCLLCLPPSATRHRLASACKSAQAKGPTLHQQINHTAGTVKIVVSTNVAETSITIDDVTAVIDTGRVKEMRFDAARGIARLQETFVSQVGGWRV